jgi:hypothetical protein
MFLNPKAITSDSQCFEEEVILVDKSPKGVESLLGEGLIVGEDLSISLLTSPCMVKEGLILLEMRERRVVLPAPDGPIMASISPGWQ